jgi:hypothetical protein
MVPKRSMTALSRIAKQKPLDARMRHLRGSAPLAIRVRPCASSHRSSLVEEASRVLRKPVRLLLRMLRMEQTIKRTQQLDDDARFSILDQRRFCTMFRICEDEFERLGFDYRYRQIKPAKRHWHNNTSQARVRQQLGRLLQLHTGIERICPRCIKEGRWPRLLQRSHFLFACTRHRTLLIDTCPNCQQRIGSSRRLSRIAATRLCANHPPNGVACTADFSLIESPRFGKIGLIVRAQHYVEGLLNGQLSTMLGRDQQPAVALQLLGELVEFVVYCHPLAQLGPIPPPLIDAVRRFRQVFDQPSKKSLAEFTADDERIDAPLPTIRLAPPAVWAAVMPLAIGFARLPSDQDLEDALYEILLSHAQERQNKAFQLLDFLQSCRSQLPLPLLNVVYDSLSRRLRKKIKLYFQTSQSAVSNGF